MKFSELPQIRWVAAAAASTALHYGVFVAQPLVSRFGTHQGQSQSSAETLHIVARVIEERSMIADNPTMTTAIAAAEEPQLIRAAASVANRAAMPEEVWRPDTDTRFYTIAEVDQPALPVLNWGFPPRRPSSIRVRHLVVHVWIAENGDILNVALLSSDPRISGEQKQDIERSLKQTRMTPATKNERPVASQRTLEMALEF